MKKSAAVIGATLVAGIAVAAVIIGMPDSAVAPEEQSAPGFDDRAGIEERVKALEAAVDAEREARQLLEDELLVLYEVIEDLDPGLDSGRTAVSESGVAENSGTDERRSSANTRRNDPNRRLTALTEAGFSVDRADWILKRESQLRMEAMQARYDTMRSGEPASLFAGPASPDSLLRNEIGDAEYEMYLTANNRPTSVNVGRVLESSPALSAGLQPGDRITHYDGERVFSTFDLTQQSLQGEVGESVVVNIVRGGAPMQVVLPRGPLGISTNRYR